MEMFGEDLSGHSEDGPDVATTTPQVPTPAPAKALEAIDRSKAKKGKLNAKSTGLTYQFQILELIGVPREEIKKFADPSHWLHFFPPIAKEDLNGIGARVDWRRQFLTSMLKLLSPHINRMKADIHALQLMPTHTMMHLSVGK